MSGRTPLARDAQRYLDEGRLVPDRITVDMVRERLARRLRGRPADGRRRRAGRGGHDPGAAGTAGEGTPGRLSGARCGRRRTGEADGGVTGEPAAGDTAPDSPCRRAAGLPGRASSPYGRRAAPWWWVAARWDACCPGSICRSRGLCVTSGLPPSRPPGRPRRPERVAACCRRGIWRRPGS
ncbi:hypothetical protein ACQF4J_01620 [Streptomyces sp. C1-1]|uniref:hypothetical protein n=1 Tax=Streptomyces sp. C1-1 TaxID=3231173 RepID=UPI003CFE4E50